MAFELDNEALDAPPNPGPFDFEFLEEICPLQWNDVEDARVLDRTDGTGSKGPLSDEKCTPVHRCIS